MIEFVFKPVGNMLGRHLHRKCMKLYITGKYGNKDKTSKNI